MRVSYSPGARRQLHALSIDVARRIVKKMKWYAAQTDPLHYAKKLHETACDMYRFRIGDYRVICDVVGGSVRILYVLAVKHRKEAYEDL